jgi:hypothetical protein
MENVWRDTRRVDGLAGYAFIPQEQRRLLIAGAEAAREHCDAILDVLGIPDDWREKARAWCVPALPSTNFCANRAGRGDGGSAPPVSKEPSYCANDDGPQPAFEERKMDCPHTYTAKARP